MSFSESISQSPLQGDIMNGNYPNGDAPIIGGGGAGNVIPTMLDGSHTYQAGSLTTVANTDGVYSADIGEGSVDQTNAAPTSWFDTLQGRLDYLTLTGDFDIQANNIGLATGATVDEYQFCGLMAWESDGNYQFAVAGNRGSTVSTIEYKSTVAFSSNQNDIGINAISNYRCDLRITRVGSLITFYFRQVGGTTWTTLPHSSLFNYVSLGAGPLRIGLVTYGWTYVPSFTTECTSVIVNSGSYT
jgi:hypothetical protein